MTRSERLEEIRKRAAAATPGPWVDDITEINQHWEMRDASGGKTIVGLEECGSAYNPWHRLVLEASDREFIAAARSDIPWLLAEVERLSAPMTMVIDGTGVDTSNLAPGELRAVSFAEIHCPGCACHRTTEAP